MNWKELYTQKLTTAEKAIKAIRNNDRVIFAHAADVPQEITKALVAHKDDFHNVEIYHMLCLGDGAYTQPPRHRKCYPTSDTTPISWEETPDKP